MILQSFESNYDFGKKGNALKKVYDLMKKEDGVIIPDTISIPTIFFDIKIKSKLRNDQILDSGEKREIINEIRNFFGNKNLVVRSSASCEDSILFTNSGQYDSFLNLKEDKEIIDAIEKVYRSFISSNAMEYYKINNIDYESNSMSVLIQEVAPVIKAGVLFTRNPITGEKKPIIEYSDGLGEDVVSGKKKVKTIKDDYDNLSNEFRKLLKIGELIEKNFKIPQDIEWGIDKNKNIFIFQSRPIIFNSKLPHLELINSPKNKIKGNSISSGFAISKINGFNNKLLLQNGQLTSKDLIPIINSSAVILQTGGYLSHFANIIREFNKPALIINEKKDFKKDCLYVVDAINNFIYQLEQLDEKEQKKVYWNFLNCLISTQSKQYLDNLGIADTFYIDDKSTSYVEPFFIEENSLNVSNNEKVLKINFKSREKLNKFVDDITEDKE